MMAEHVTIVEMGPRDGLQNEKIQIDTSDKVSLIDQLSGCGYTRIEVTSFVSPKWVPQLADAKDVMAQITRKPEISYAVLTPNLQGFENALRANANEVAVFASASEGFSKANINCSIDESLKRFKPVLTAAKAAKIPVRGYVSCVTDCPYDGAVAPANTAYVASALLDMGCFEVSLGDTTGKATPTTVTNLLQAVQVDVPTDQLAGHFHDTHDQALKNIQVCLSKGIRVFDAAVGGLGGCPYAPGAKGNVATRSVAEMLHKLGFETGLDLDKLNRTTAFAESLRSD